MEIAPTGVWGRFLGLCSAVSYFSTRVGSIIGAGRLSFRVRDGSGRFPAAMYRRNFMSLVVECPPLVWGKFCGPLVIWWWGVVVVFVVVVARFVVVVSFRPVSASSLRLLLGV